MLVALLGLCPNTQAAGQNFAQQIHSESPYLLHLMPVMILLLLFSLFMLLSLFLSAMHVHVQCH